MNEQVAELIQQMKDKYGNKWARELLWELDILGNEPSNKAYAVFSPLFDWIEKAINAHDALVEALESLAATLKGIAATDNQPPHIVRAAIRRQAERAYAVAAKAKGEEA